MDHLIVDLLRPAGASLRFFGPSKFDDRKSNPNNWFKKTQRGFETIRQGSTVIWGKMDHWGKMSQYIFLTLKYCERNWGHVSASIFLVLLNLNIFLSRKKVLALQVVDFHF